MPASDPAPGLGSSTSSPASDAADGSVTLFFHRLREGGSDGADGLWAYFFPRLVRLARTALAHRPQRMADAEDAAQSALISFWEQARNGQLSREMHRDNLWSLLGLITLRKAKKQLRREAALRRGAGRIVGEGDLPEGTGLDALAATLPAHDFDLVCEEHLMTLDSALREIAVLRLFGHSTAEIAGQLGCTQRKVQRKLELLQLKWEHLLED